jgi:DNA-binding beta-propeller fold protein YncE
VVHLLDLCGGRALLAAKEHFRAQDDPGDGQLAAGVTVDPFWPRPLPEGWMLGEIGGLHVDDQDHLWVLSRPRTLEAYDTYAAAVPPRADCCVAAPPVIELDPEGNLVQAWGWPGDGYQWPENEHGIYVDAAGNVWIGGNGANDHQILKFARDGTFQMQIGRAGESGGSNDTANLNRPANMMVHEASGELLVADGYQNRRVIVFDAGTGAYRRHWGAYGNVPDDAAPRARTTEGPGDPQFNLVHGLVLSGDDLVYVADRVNKRIQVFTLEGEFVREAFVARENTSEEGTAYGFALSPDPGQQYLYVANGSDKVLRVLDRETLDEVGTIGLGGGHMAGQFFHLHMVAADSRGAVYTGEGQGKRVQRFVSPPAGS